MHVGLQHARAARMHVVLRMVWLCAQWQPCGGVHVKLLKSINLLLRSRALKAAAWHMLSSGVAVHCSQYQTTHLAQLQCFEQHAGGVRCSGPTSSAAYWGLPFQLSRLDQAPNSHPEILISPAPAFCICEGRMTVTMGATILYVALALLAITTPGTCPPPAATLRSIIRLCNATEERLSVTIASLRGLFSPASIPACPIPLAWPAQASAQDESDCRGYWCIVLFISAR